MVRPKWILWLVMLEMFLYVTTCDPIINAGIRSIWPISGCIMIQDIFTLKGRANNSDIIPLTLSMIWVLSNTYSHPTIGENNFFWYGFTRHHHPLLQFLYSHNVWVWNTCVCSPQLCIFIMFIWEIVFVWTNRSLELICPCSSLSLFGLTIHRASIN